VRDAAARTQCTNNIKQLGLAVANYENTTGKLPPGWSTFQGSNSGTLHYFILPFIEQGNLYTAAGNNSASLFPTTPLVKTFSCPADSTNNTTNPNGGSNYAWNVLVFGGGGSWTTDMRPGSIIQAMTDGTSNTVIFAERYKLCSPSGGSVVTQPQWAATPAYATSANLGLTIISGFGFGVYGGAYGATGLTATYGGKTWNYPFSGGVMPSPMIPDILAGTTPFQAGVAAVNCNPLVVQGPHTSVMIVGMGDGSVRGVNSNISAYSWATSCDPIDGYIVGSDW
jgi:Protein of unknown function (DUF1559)